MKILFDDLKFSILTDETDLSSFDCGDPEIDTFLKEDAKEYQRDKIATTYLAYYNNELAGFFSIANGCIRAEAVESQDGKKEYRPQKYPAIKIAQIGTCRKFQGEDVGKNMLKLVVAMALSLGKYVGCRVILVDSKKDPRLLHFYQDYGLFERFGDGKSKTIPLMRDIKKIDTTERINADITKYI